MCMCLCSLYETLHVQIVQSSNQMDVTVPAVSPCVTRTGALTGRYFHVDDRCKTQRKITIKSQEGIFSNTPTQMSIRRDYRIWVFLYVRVTWDKFTGDNRFSSLFLKIKDSCVGLLLVYMITAFTLVWKDVLWVFCFTCRQNPQVI